MLKVDINNKTDVAFVNATSFDEKINYLILDTVFVKIKRSPNVQANTISVSQYIFDQVKNKEKILSLTKAERVVSGVISIDSIHKGSDIIKASLIKKLPGLVVSDKKIFCVNVPTKSSIIPVWIKYTGEKFGIISSKNISGISFKYESGLDLSPAKKLEDFANIGGLDSELELIIERIVSTRYIPKEFKEAGIYRPKGIILHGPPGTGKTLIARTLSNKINATSFKVVNGPEILNKYVGQSEENVRELFKEAEQDKNPNSLHVVVLDEMDAFLRARGGSHGEVFDKVVNQILSKMDGVKAIDNILLIGTTNKLELLDKALLRPKRFELQIRIPLPSFEGRIQIYKIYLKKLIGKCSDKTPLDLEYLSSLSKGFSGADIESVVGRVNNKMFVSKNFSYSVSDFVRVIKETPGVREEMTGVSETDVAVLEDLLSTSTLSNNLIAVDPSPDSDKLMENISEHLRKKLSIKGDTIYIDVLKDVLINGGNIFTLLANLTGIVKGSVVVVNNFTLLKKTGGYYPRSEHDLLETFSKIGNGTIVILEYKTSVPPPPPLGALPPLPPSPPAGEVDYENILRSLMDKIN